ncbi:MAG: hypothetical protein J6M60_00630 [Clostridia bacterium]|nr:hypothetical protein [Clostridia bacterium]
MKRLNKQKIKNKLWLSPSTLLLLPTKVLATSSGSIGTAEVNQATENIKNAVVKLAMPIGGILVFVSIVIIALKMIVNSNNANKRSESIGALAWVCAGTMLLGLSLIISGIILSIATNGGGGLITGG